MKRAVAITGIGLVSPHGQHPFSVFDALCDGVSAVAPWTGARADCVAATAPFDPSQWFSRLQLTGVDRVSQIAVAAALDAQADAGLLAIPEEAGVYVGCGMGGAAALEVAFQQNFAGGRIPPLTVPAFMPNAPAAHVAMRLGIHGRVLTYSVACASSALALAEAAHAVSRGDLDLAVAGGSEALLVPSVVNAWQALNTLAPPDEHAPWASCRPFSASRRGFVLGEGAAFLILEPLEHARQRQAPRIYAELAGSGTSCDASHLTKPDARGQIRALHAALTDAGMAPGEVGYCNAHGTATQAGDMAEWASLAAVWGDALAGLRVSSTKALHGHLLGAAGALEAAITAMALARQRCPAARHVDAPDPACPLTLATESLAGEPPLMAAISNSFAFGGTNVVLAFRRAPARPD